MRHMWAETGPGLECDSNRKADIILDHFRTSRTDTFSQESRIVSGTEMSLIMNVLSQIVSALFTPRFKKNTLINRLAVLINKLIFAVSIKVSTHATELGPEQGVRHHHDGGPIICH